MQKFNLTLFLFFFINFLLLSQSTIIQKSVVSSGGSRMTTNGLMLNATAGQPTIGNVQNQSLLVKQGFWYTVNLGINTKTIEGLKDIEIVSLYPNPADYIGKIEIFLEFPTILNIEIADILGAKIASIFSGQAQQGNSVFEIDLSNLNDGIYFIIIHANQDLFTKKLIVIKDK